MSFSSFKWVLNYYYKRIPIILDMADIYIGSWSAYIILMPQNLELIFRTNLFFLKYFYPNIWNFLYDVALLNSQYQQLSLFPLIVLFLQIIAKIWCFNVIFADYKFLDLNSWRSFWFIKQQDKRFKAFKSNLF